MKTPDEEYFKNPIINPRYIKKHYPEFYNYLLEHYDWTSSISESLYAWKYNIKISPNCPICGKKNKFLGFNQGYSKYCSNKCSNSDPIKINKTKQSCLKKYGVENPSQSQEIKSKTARTNLEKYGSENVFGSKKIREKIKKTNLEKYGVEYTGSSDQIREKIKKTNLEKYGVSCGVQTNKAKIRRYESLKQAQHTKYDEIISIDYDNGIYACSCPHPECNKCTQKHYNIKISTFFDRKRDKTEPCTILLSPEETHSKNTSLEIFIKNILDEHNIIYLTNVRDIIPPQEIDIYIPSKKIGIECNGIYWHSSLKKDSNYHINKFLKCQQQGIQLLTIWEDWIQNKPEIVRSMILSKLELSKTIGARKCIIKNVDPKISEEFLQSNHIQGRSRGKVKLGLYYHGELVSLMVLGSRQTMKSKNEGEWDLIRFCNKCGYNIIGGASKLLKYFINQYQPDIIYSFSSNDISNGNLYKKLGFEKQNINQSYWYIEGKTLTRYHRTSFTKDAIISKGWKQSKEGWVESEIMRDHGYYQIYDSGQTKWSKQLLYN